MKNYSKTLIAVIVFFTVSSIGQNIPVTINKSEIFKEEFEKSQIVLSVKDENGGAIVVRTFDSEGLSPHNGYYFEHYDKNLKLIKELELVTDVPIFQKNKNILCLYYTQNKVFICDILFDLKEKAFVCSMTILDCNNFNQTKKELFKLTKDEVKKLGMFSLIPAYKNNEYDKFLNEDKKSAIKMYFNKDKTTFAILVDFNSKDSETFKLQIFDNQLNLKFDKIFIKEIDDDKFELQNLEISNDGNSMYVLGKVFTSENKEKNNGGKYQFELTTITKEQEKTVIIDVNEHYVKSLKTFVQSDKLIAIGFYSNKNDNRFKGICYFELNPDNLASQNIKFNNFTEQFNNDKYGQSKSKELKNLVLKDILILENKDIVLTAEESYVYSYGYGSGGVGGIGGIGGGQTYYNFSDIVCAKLAKDGNLIWARNINKSQSATMANIPFNSYSSMNKDNDVLFFINASEDVKNLDDNRIEFIGTRKNKYNLHLLQIKDDGNFYYQKILDDEQNEVPFMVSSGIICEDSIFFLGIKGRKKQLLKVNF